MTRFLRPLTAVFAALVFGGLSVAPAFAATRAGSPTPAELGRQISSLQQQLQQQQATINSLADQEESEQASVNALHAKVTSDQQKEKALNQQLNRVARIEYERPALTLTTILNAHNLGQLLTGMSEARVISHQQQRLFHAATALRADDQQSQAAAQVQLDKISKQQAEATALSSKTQTEISTLQAQQAAEVAAEQKAAQLAAQQKAAQQAAAQQRAAAAAAAAQRPATQQQVAAAPRPAAPQQVATPRPATPAPTAAPVQRTAPAVSSGGAITLRPGPSNPNRFQVGQCTWYVATIYSIPWLGNADQWPAAAAADGQAEGSTPVAGAIMESADSAYGHVSVVTSVSDYNDWTVTEMNYAGGPGVQDTRHVSRATSNLVTFIY